MILQFDQMPVDQYVQVNEIKTRYWELGREHGGVPLVLLHGNSGRVEWWLTNIFMLAERYHVYAIDLVGSGKTDKPQKTYRFEDLAQFVRDVLDVLNLQQSTIAGHSAGGAVALAFALSFPERLHKLILINSGGLGQDIRLEARLVTLPLVGELLNHPSQFGIRLLVRGAVYNPDSFLKDDTFMTFLYESKLDQAMLDFWLRTVRTGVDFWGQRLSLVQLITNRLSEIAVPTLVIWGRQDRFVPVSHGEMAARIIPNTSLHILENCGHWTPMEQPEAFNRVVTEFLQA